MEAPAYQRSRAWSLALAARPADPDEAVRERLRATFRRMRERAAALAGEIGRDLPEFTVHDITHLDALWELVDLIGGDGLVLTPCEAFVLGGAILTHDLGMTAAAYPGGHKELRAMVEWKDSVARLMLREGLRSSSTTSPPAELASEADREVLRRLHGNKALEIPNQRWTDAKGRAYFFIEDSELRETFGQLIGELAGSHWWSTTKLRDSFDRVLGAPAWCPSSWTVDPLRVACLLRAADAAHVDARRAPAFLHALRRPSGVADDHWEHQRRMRRVTLRGEQLEVGSTTPFTAAESAAWWIAVETLRMIDGELRAIDALLQATNRSRFAARRVAAVDDLRALQSYLQVEGWRPVDTRVRVSDIPALIERLGGRKLYGLDPDAPLRELIQNAADAIRARRAYEGRSPDWGRICVASGEDEHGPWLEVSDDGLGMSETLLVGPLLDFGVSYWRSELCSKEYPGLLASGFRSVGEFGIGFFSVFMLGSRVQVKTRWCQSAETSILEFDRGFGTPPLLRVAANQERLVDAGTTVRIWPTNEEAQVWYGGPSTLAARCERLCPTLDIDVFVQEGDVPEPERVITARDWLKLDPASFVLRIAGSHQERVEDVLVEPRLDDTDLGIERVLGMLEPIVDPDSHETVGRACVLPPWLGRYGCNALVTRGLRIGDLRSSSRVLGVLEGSPTRAARDEGVVSVRQEVIDAWLERQEDQAERLYEGFERFELAGVFAELKQGPVTRLPVLWGSCGQTLLELAVPDALPEVVVLVFPGTFSGMAEERMKPLCAPPEHVFLMCGHWRLDVGQPETINPTFIGILLSVARGWGVALEEVLGSSLMTSVIEGRTKPAIPKDEVWGERFHVLVRPGATRDAKEEALQGFYEFVGRETKGKPMTASQMAYLGKVIGDARREAFAKKQRARGDRREDLGSDKGE